MLKAWNSPEAGNWIESAAGTWHRSAGLNETGFYHYGLSDAKAPSDTFCRISTTLVKTTRQSLEDGLLNAWRQLRLLHPLLDCQFRQSESRQLSLEYSWEGRQSRASSSLICQSNVSRWEAIHAEVTNCPRIISDRELSQLRVYIEEKDTTDDLRVELVLVCSHAISDGLSILSTMNDLMHLLSTGSLSQLHSLEIRQTTEFVLSRLPRAMESQLPERKRTPRALWREAIAHTLHQVRQCKARGPSPTFPACRDSPRTRQVIYEFSARDTGLLRAACRKNGCTIGHLIYAASTAAFADLVAARAGSEAFIGTPINARRMFHKDFRNRADELVLSISFLSVFLPCVAIDSDGSYRNQQRLWTLSRLARKSLTGSMQDPFFPIYSFIEQEKRVARHQSNKVAATTGSAAPVLELSFGSSSIGDLNKILQTETIPYSIHDIGVGMRARRGEALMHSYSFQNKLRLSLTYDAQLGHDIVTRWLNATAKLMLMVAPSPSTSAVKL